MNDARPYPFDFDALEKGQTITPEELASKCGHAPGTRKYQLAVLGYRDLIMKRLKALGRPATVKIQGEGLRILTDSEAVQYNDKRMGQSDKHKRVTFRRMRDVDRTQLSEDEARNHERRLFVRSKELVAVKLASREAVKELEHKRRTPLPPPEKV